MGVYFCSKLEELDNAKVSHLVAGAVAEVTPSAWESSIGYLTHEEVCRVISRVARQIHNGEFPADIIQHETTVDGLALSWLASDCEMVKNLMRWLGWGQEETLSFG